MSKEVIEPETSHYKKKSQTASKSNSKKRADHKHKYESVIIKWFFGYKWGRRCTLCGRVQEKTRFSTDRCFLKPEALNKPGITLKDYLSISEIRDKYPGMDIYEIDKYVYHGGRRYRLLEETAEEKNERRILRL